MSASRSWRPALAVLLLAVLAPLVRLEPAAASAPSPVRAVLVVADGAPSAFLAGWVADGSGAPVAGLPVTITASTAAGTSVVATPTTAVNGLVFASVARPAGNITYRLLAGADVVAIASVGDAPVVPKAATAPAGPTSVNLPGYRDLEVDDVHGQVFVSTGTGVRTFDLDGVPGPSVAVLGGAGHLALSRDQTTLYVALDQVGTIAVVDTASRSVVGTLRLPEGAGAGDGFFGLEVVGQKLAAGLHRSGQWDAALAVVPLGDPGAAKVTDGGHPGVYPGRLAASTARNEVAVFGDTSGIHTVFFDVSGDEPILIERSFPAASSSSYPHDMDYSADGKTMLLTAGAPYNARRASVATGEVLTTYPIGAYAASVTASRDERYVATSRYGYGRALRVFDSATGTLVAELQAGSDQVFSDYAQHDGLAFSADESRLYAVQAPWNGTTRLEVWPNPTVACSVGVVPTRNVDGTVRIDAQVGWRGQALDGSTIRFTAVHGATSSDLGSVAVPDDGGDLTVDPGVPAGTTEIRAEVAPVAGRGCVAANSVGQRTPSAPPSVASFGGTGGLVAFWVAPVDPGSSPIVAQSLLVLQDGGLVRWVNVDPDAWFASVGDLAPGAYEVLVVAWNAQGLGAVPAPVQVRVS